MVAGKWIALNASTGKIPSTETFQRALEDWTFSPLEVAAHPPGWTWTKQPTWYAGHYHWDAWIVVDLWVWASALHGMYESFLWISNAEKYLK